MKIALCLSGLARTFNQCYQSYLDKIINHYDCDVFIYVSKDSNSHYMDLVKSVGKVILETDPVLDEKDLARYKKRMHQYTTQGLLQQFWKIKMCNDIMLEYQKDNNIHYDWVIRSRPDLLITRKIDDLNKLDNNIMYIPLYTEQLYYKKHQELLGKFYPLDKLFDYSICDCLPDRFAFSSPELMTVYANRYDEIEELVKRAGQLYAENCICQHLKYHKVPVQITMPMYILKR